MGEIIAPNVEFLKVRINEFIYIRLYNDSCIDESFYFLKIFYN